MAAFGSALRALVAPVNNASVAGAVQCGADIATAPPLVLELSGEASFDTVMMREDLSHGQRVESYALDYFDGTTQRWHAFRPCPDPAHCLPDDRPAAIPPVPRGTCGPVDVGTNLVFNLPPSTHLAGVVDNATACRSLCDADPACNFWTWHDTTNIPAWAKKCYVRTDALYVPIAQPGHTSGICNKTLPAPIEGGGVHGQSVGARLLDMVGNTTTTKIRFRCTASLARDGVAHIRSLSVHDASKGKLLA